MNEIYTDHHTKRYLVIIEKDEDKVIFETITDKGDKIGRTAFATSVFRGALNAGLIYKIDDAKLAKALLEGIDFGEGSI